MYGRYLLTGYCRYIIEREYWGKGSLGIGNGILWGILELVISVSWLGNILVIVVRGQLL